MEPYNYQINTPYNEGSKSRRRSEDVIRAEYPTKHMFQNKNYVTVDRLSDTGRQFWRQERGGQNEAYNKRSLDLRLQHGHRSEWRRNESIQRITGNAVSHDNFTSTSNNAPSRSSRNWRRSPSSSDYGYSQRSPSVGINSYERNRYESPEANERERSYGSKEDYYSRRSPNLSNESYRRKLSPDYSRRDVQNRTKSSTSNDRNEYESNRDEYSYRKRSAQRYSNSNSYNNRIPNAGRTFESNTKGIDSLREEPEKVESQQVARVVHGVAQAMEMDKGSKPRLSGAQKRRIRKAEKIASGKWTEDNPKKPAPQKQAPGRKAEEPEKRPSSDLSTPEKQNPTKRHRSQKQTLSFNVVAKGLKMAIIDRRHPGVLLDQGKADAIQRKLLELIAGTPSGSSTPPQFESTSFAAGVCWMYCANDVTKNWLKANIALLGNLWEGADLTVVESKDLPKRPRVLVHVPDASEEKHVRSWISKQNPLLKTDGWIQISRKVEEKGQTLAYSIDEASMKALEANNLRAYYKMGKLFFRALKSGPSDADKGTLLS